MPVLLGPVMEQFAVEPAPPKSAKPATSLKHCPQFESWPQATEVSDNLSWWLGVRLGWLLKTAATVHVRKWKVESQKRTLHTLQFSWQVW